MIPKIIHHIAPENKNRWHPLWQRCYDSWKKQFIDFEFILWNDEKDIDSLVKNYFNQFWSTYSSFPVHIMRIDFARFCILHKYGGIYADMDVFCYKNFYDVIEDNKVYLLPAPYGSQSANGNNLLENALMISPCKHIFFQKCLEYSSFVFGNKIKKYNIRFPLNYFEQTLVVNTAGPVCLDNVFELFKKDIKILDYRLFNNHGLSYDVNFYTKHLLTGIWGKESLLLKKNNDYLDEVKKFANLENVTLDNFDFYKDYTNGGYLK